MDSFCDNFWRDVDKLSATLKANSLAAGGCSLQELIATLGQLPPEGQEQRRHDVGVLVARLIQIDRALQACRQGREEVEAR